MIYDLSVDYLCERKEEVNDFSTAVSYSTIYLHYIRGLVKKHDEIFAKYYKLTESWFRYPFNGIRVYFGIPKENIRPSKLPYLREISNSPHFERRENVGNYGLLCLLKDKKPLNVPFYSEIFTEDFNEKFKENVIYSDIFYGPLNVVRILRVYELKWGTAISFDNFASHIVFLPKNLNPIHLRFIMTPFAHKNWFDDDRMRGFYEKLNDVAKRFPENKSLQYFVEEFNRIYTIRALNILGDKI
jgi:hypothetical protein